MLRPDTAPRGLTPDLDRLHSPSSSLSPIDGWIAHSQPPVSNGSPESNRATRPALLARKLSAFRKLFRKLSARKFSKIFGPKIIRLGLHRQPTARPSFTIITRSAVRRSLGRAWPGPARAGSASPALFEPRQGPIDSRTARFEQLRTARPAPAGPATPAEQDPGRRQAKPSPKRRLGFSRLGKATRIWLTRRGDSERRLGKVTRKGDSER